MLRPYPYHLRRYPYHLRPYHYHLRPYPYRHPRRAQHLRRLRAATTARTDGSAAM